MYICPPAARKRLRVRGTRLAVGFGMVAVIKDGKNIWVGDNEKVSLYRFEKMARQEPGEWKVEFHGPLSGQVYVRTDINRWELESTNRGFA